MSVPGERVTVYHDPVSWNDPEGEAVLKNYVIEMEEDLGLYLWDVEFVEERGRRYSRTVVAPPPGGGG